MDSLQKYREENTPYLQLLMLVFYAIIGMIIMLLAAFLVIGIIYGLADLKDLSWLSGFEPKYLPAQRILLCAQQIGLFLVPVLLLALTERKKIQLFYHFKKPKPELLLLVVGLMTLSMPVMEWAMLVNQKMVLPEFLRPLEQWMKASEERAMAVTTALLKMDDTGTYLLNLGMIALLPAIAEEMMFRGALQRSFARMFNNHHLAIWSAAFLFSAIHVQFYGFLPRLLLGAGFGYIYYWTKSLWYAMFAHFLNNGYAVTAAWYMQKNNIPLTEADKTANFAWYGYVISAVLTFILFWIFKNKTLDTHEQQLD